MAAVAAFAGDQAGYVLGKRFGRRLFKPDARVLKIERLEKAASFFARYGGASLVLGRFVPFVRTYVPLAAGIAALPYRRFLPWNALGGVSWAVLMAVLGVLLAGIPFVTHNIDALMILVVAVSILPRPGTPDAAPFPESAERQAPLSRFWVPTALAARGHRGERVSPTTLHPLEHSVRCETCCSRPAPVRTPPGTRRPIQ